MIKRRGYFCAFVIMSVDDLSGDHSSSLPMVSVVNVRCGITPAGN